MTPLQHFVYHFATWTCVASSFVLKLPQLFAVLQARSAEGLTTPSIMFEMWSFATEMIYSIAEKLPLLQYIDYIFVMVQEIILFLLVLHYNRHFNIYSLLYCIVFVLVFTPMLLGMTSSAFNTLLINLNLPVNVSGKIAQLSTIIREKSAGSVSPMTWFLAAYGCFARMLTLTMEAPDPSLLVLFGISGVFNLAIMLACLYYGPGKPAAKKD